GLTKNYKVLIQSMLERVEKTGVNIGTLFMDREFFHIEPISVAQKLNVKFVIAAKSNARSIEYLMSTKKHSVALQLFLSIILIKVARHLIL
ncbi:MAG: hypothetical protein ACT6FF_06340, partial [Methanosarcinaceae archaeon]